MKIKKNFQTFQTLLMNFHCFYYYFLIFFSILRYQFILNNVLCILPNFRNIFKKIYAQFFANISLFSNFEQFLFYECNLMNFFIISTFFFFKSTPSIHFAQHFNDMNFDECFFKQLSQIRGRILKKIWQEQKGRYFFDLFATPLELLTALNSDPAT